MEVVLDFDGTLADRCGYSFSWLLALLRSHGYLGTAEDVRAAMECCTDFDAASRLGIKDRPEELTQKLLLENRRSLEHAVWNNALRPVLCELAGAHVLHVVSNRDQESLEEGLTLIGCRDLFGSCVGSTPDILGKPSTALFRRLRSEAPPTSACGVYIGDQLIDREFARKAGLEFIAACWYRDTLEDDDACCISLEALPAQLARLRRECL